MVRISNSEFEPGGWSTTTTIGEYQKFEGIFILFYFDGLFGFPSASAISRKKIRAFFFAKKCRVIEGQATALASRRTKPKHSLLDEQLFRNYLGALYSPVVFSHLGARCSAADFRTWKTDGALLVAWQWHSAGQMLMVEVEWIGQKMRRQKNWCWQLHNQGNSVLVRWWDSARISTLIFTLSYWNQYY